MLFRNTLAQSSSMLIGYAFSFLLAPIMIARLGLDAFGLWAITGALAAYAGLLDLGIGRSLSRFIAVYDVQGDERRIRECVGLGLIAVLAVGVAAAVAAAAAAPFLSDRIGVLQVEQMRVVVLASVAMWTLNGIDGVLSAVGIGKRQMLPPNVAAIAGNILNFAFSIGALAASSSLQVYALANVAAGVGGLIPSYLAMRYVWAGPHFAMPSRALTKEVLAFGVKNQIGWLADLVNMQTDKVVIALLIGVRAAAAYEIASRVVLAVRSTAILTTSAMIPTAAARIVDEGRQAIAAMYGRVTLRSCAIAFPLFVIASVSAPFLLVAWLGSVPKDSELLVPLLNLAYLVNITTGSGTTIAIGAGNPGMAATNAVQIAVLNVVLTIALAPLFGLWGVVLGTLIAISVGSIVFNVRFARHYELPWETFRRAVLPPALLSITLAVPSALLLLAVGVPETRWGAVPWLAVSATAYLLPYWVLATRRGLLPAQLEFPFPRRGKSTATTQP